MMKDWTDNRKLVTLYAVLDKKITQKCLLYTAIFYTGFAFHMFLF